MRHLNEIVRERNQHSRDALEAWTDFINLKQRMDNELSKASKRSNGLEQELETWKSQFLKFQAFAEQLNKEVSELRVKIESHKRENRRLTGIIDSQKDDAARLTQKVAGTERQRDNALEALVLQQGIAEDLERERARNRKELAALQHTNQTHVRQRDEAQRVVLHLRSLINGQTHHMEHIVRSLGTAPELSKYIKDGYEDSPEDGDDDVEPDEATKDGAADGKLKSNTGLKRSSSPGSVDGEEVTAPVEEQLLARQRNSKRFSNLSMADVADRQLRDKTDAIADIIRNISEQCAAAVEGLQLANVELDDEELAGDSTHARKALGHLREDSVATGNLHVLEDGQTNADAISERGNGHLTPTSEMPSSVPSTPELVHRSSTSMSMASSANTTLPERTSVQFNADTTKIAEYESPVEKFHGQRSGSSESGATETSSSKREPAELMSRAVTLPQAA